jgi:signal transduction histidine kinase
MSASRSPEAVTDLRDRAESLLAQRGVDVPMGEADRLRLLHELQVHQIELELQNDELRKAQLETQEALSRLVEFNDRLEELVSVRTTDLVTARDVADASNRAKSMFLANMSHELRTPMTGIIGMTDLALRNATANPALVSQLNKVKTASYHLLGILNDILDMAAIEAEKLTIANINFTLSDVIKNLTDIVSFQADQKGLLFDVEIDPELAKKSVCGDSMRLTQILINLAGNAIKFTAHGSVCVRVLSTEENDSAVVLRFEVIDTGIGISANDQRRIFTAFEQSDGSTTREHGGTGLGLTISRQIVGLMGGDLEVSSEPEKGSTFYFSVRLKKANGFE